VLPAQFSRANSTRAPAGTVRAERLELNVAASVSTSAKRSGKLSFTPLLVRSVRACAAVQTSRDTGAAGASAAVGQRMLPLPISMKSPKTSAS
jgi:hypothetical protein